MAPETAVIEYVWLELVHGEMFPVMVPGFNGAAPAIVTDNVLAELVPQLLLALTEIMPPLLPGVVVIEFEVDEPVQPDGKVHV